MRVGVGRDFSLERIIIRNLRDIAFSKDFKLYLQNHLPYNVGIKSHLSADMNMA